MKIYASTPEYDFDQFIGQDVWVKCICNEAPEYPISYWFNILAKDDTTGSYIVHRVPDVFVRKGEFHCNLSTYNALISKTGIRMPISMVLRNIKIAVPLEMYTTDEFLVAEDDWRL